MFPQLVVGDFLSSHWLVVITTGASFFIIQIVLTALFCLRMRQHQRVLKQLSGDFEMGNGGRRDLRALPESFVWLRWVFVTFPAGISTPPGNYTRDEVLQELDTRIASDPNYLLLQRMGVMAPLLGVVLTVIGFYWLQVGEEEQSLQSILLAVTPLVSGVGTGAVLALINQILLHVAGRRVEALRMSARTWFDTVIWSNIGLDTQAATAKAVRAVERLADSMDDAVGRYADSSSQIDGASASMKDAAAEFRTVVQSFSAEINGMPAALSDIRRSTAASADALAELSHVGSRAVANLDVSVAAFRTTLDREFTAAAKLHHRSSKTLAEAVQQIAEAAELIKSGSDELKLAAQASTATSDRMNESIRQHIVPANRQFHEMVQDVTGQVTSFSRAVRELCSNVDVIASRFDTVARALVPSVNSFCEVIEGRFSPAVAQHSGQLMSVAHSIERLQEMSGSMADASSSLSVMLRELSGFVSQARTVYERLAGSSGHLADAGQFLQRSIASDLAPSHQSMRETAASLAESALHLADFTEQGLGPATRQLITLHETLSGLKQIVDSIKEARPDIDRLAHALTRAAEVNDATSLLPNRSRDVVDPRIDHAGLANSRRGLRTWLSRRPR